VAFDVQETRRLAEGAAVLVAPGDTEALARELVGLLDDSAERERLGRVGSERVRLHVAWERQSEVYLDTIAGLIQQRRGRRSEAATPRSPAAATADRPSAT
jgi:glycosyltransferase involved in cell wall biosynthesis